ncbi:MAG: BCAM0308 family protein [Nitrospiraceae bacterium]
MPSHVHPCQDPVRVGSAQRRNVSGGRTRHLSTAGEAQGAHGRPTCGAVFHKGRWTWDAKPAGEHETLCPACHRIHDTYPKGLVTITGPFKDTQHEQLIGVVKNTEEKEKKEHPLSRIMAIESRPEGLVISTTDTHLPRRIGEGLKHAYHGELELHYDQDEQFVRVTWTR